MYNRVRFAVNGIKMKLFKAFPIIVYGKAFLLLHRYRNFVINFSKPRRILSWFGNSLDIFQVSFYANAYALLRSSVYLHVLDFGNMPTDSENVTH